MKLIKYPMILLLTCFAMQSGAQQIDATDCVDDPNTADVDEALSEECLALVPPAITNFLPLALGLGAGGLAVLSGAGGGGTTSTTSTTN